MFLNLFLFYQVVRPLGRESVNKYWCRPTCVLVAVIEHVAVAAVVINSAAAVTEGTACPVREIDGYLIAYISGAVNK